ncbi:MULTISPECIES: glutamate ABC transporter substrate-binding protein [Streptomyces]|uniref:glutamate ABC transporter substrate-binding protein n=1 Tax=Streptomyces TaxID=1883 RepID=UPI000BB103F8|nr:MULTISPECIES: glutamate ABC transporter substrate-binding protein [Streptomyces]MCT9104577.1 glutamate ABC transporter substrate-binding protein [Streptomyces mirabilis]MCX4433918.1 glutamate ABC transporter substrate-binding protein [Streptomyces mirabilis]
MTARRLRASLRGWGGVGAMALALVVTAVFALLLPLSSARGDGSTGTGGQGVGQGIQARADTCTDPQDQSPSPSSDDSGKTITAIKQRGYLSVGVDQNSYRWGYRDPNNTAKSSDLEGFDIDLAHEIAREILGDPNAVRFHAIPTNQRIPAIKSGQVDMVVRTMTITCSRLKDVAFSAPYFLTGQQVLAPKTSGIKGYDNTLAGKRICSAAGSTAYDKLSADKKAGTLTSSADITTTVPNQLDCLVRLQLGQVDAVVTDGALAASQAAQDPTVELKGKTFTDDYYGVAMKLGADDLVRRVNQVLVDYRKSGGWQASYTKWLSATLKADSPSATPPTAHYK